MKKCVSILTLLGFQWRQMSGHCKYNIVRGRERSRWWQPWEEPLLAHICERSSRKKFLWKYHKMCETASKCSLAQNKHVLKSTSHIGLQWRLFAHTSNRIYVGQTNLGCMWTLFRKSQIVDKCCILLHITVLANASSVGLPWVGQSSIHLLQMVEHNQRYIFFCIEYK